MKFSFSIVRSTRADGGGGGSNGGKSIDNGLEESGGDVLIHPFDCDSGDRRQLTDEGGVNGIHIGASGERDDELINNGIGRFVERATNRTAKIVPSKNKTRLTSKSCSSRCRWWCRLN